MASEGVVGTLPVTGYVKSRGDQMIYNRPNNSAAATGSILTSLDVSIFLFHSQLLRCFSKLARAATATQQVITQGYKRSGKCIHPPVTYAKEKRTVVLDLDETLVHSTTEPPKVKFDFVVWVKTEATVTPMFVVKRPGVGEFLERLGENYKVVVFTAGVTEYASRVSDKLDEKHVITQRLYRDSCKKVDGKYVKDLSLVEEKDPRNVLIIDDNPSSFSLQPENGVPIKPFEDDMKDQELMKLMEFFDGCYRYEDMRVAVSRFLTDQLL